MERSPVFTPRPHAYAVKAGDTLYSIGWRFGLDVQGLARANGLRPPYTIYPGQDIRLVVQLLPDRRTKPSVPPPEANLSWRWPTKSRVVRDYGRGNKGIDFLVESGTAVGASAKGEVVYAYHLAREAIRERGRAVLCEGYLDVIAAHGADVTEAVASLGTALTESQAKLLRRLADRVVFLYDADAAGRSATLRGCEILIRHGLKVFIAPLETGLDPDDVVRLNGPRALRELVDNAQPALQFLAEWLLNLGDGPAEPLERRIWVLESLGPCLRANSNEISRDHEIGKVAQWVGIEEDLVRRHLARPGPGAARDLQQDLQQRKLDRPPMAEQALLRCLLERPELGDRVPQREVLDWVTHAGIRRWIQRLLDAPRPSKGSKRCAAPVAEWLALADGDDEVLLREILMAEEDYSDPERLLAYTLSRLEREAARRRLVGTCQKFGAAPDAESAGKTAREIHELGSQIFPETRNPMRAPNP